MRNESYVNEHWDELSHRVEWKELMFRINTLRRSTHIEAKLLMAKLLCCSPEERCGSLACPLCIEIDRQEFTSSVVELFSKYKNKSFLTYIPYTVISSDKNLYDLELNFIKDKFRCYLKNSKISSPAVGCVEVDYDVNTNTWIPHIHVIIGLIPPKNFTHMRIAINKKHIPARVEATARPLVRKHIYNLENLCDYVYKFMWQRKPETKNRSIKINKTRMPFELFVEHLIYIDKLCMRNLEFRYGVRRDKNGLQIIP